MKRSLSILLALVMFCLAAIVTMPAVSAENDVTDVQKQDITYTLVNWEGESAQFGFFDPNGNQLFPFQFTFTDWKEVYMHTNSIYSISMDITAPSGTEEGKVLALEVPEEMLGNPSDEQWNQLLNEGEYEEIADGNLSVKIDIADLNVEENGNRVSVFPRRKFMTVLFAWKDAQGSVTMQKLGVVVMHPFYEEIVLKENGEYVEAQIAPFNRNDSVVAVVEYLEAEQGQQLPYATTLENGRMVVDMHLQQSDYENIYANMPEEAEGSYLSVEIAPPEGAASFAIETVGYASETIAQDLLNGTFWFELDGQDRVGRGLEYAFVQHENNRIVITPAFFEHNIMVAWKDQDGKLINVGTTDEVRYVEHLCVTVVPENTDVIEIETTAEPSVMMRYNRDAEVLVMPEFMPPVLAGEQFPYQYTLENGVLDIVTAYDLSDYQKVYDQLPGGTEQLYMSVEVTPPANAKYFNVASTGYPDESVALGLMNMNKDNYQEITEDRKTAGRGYDFAILRRYDETILIQPTEGQYHLIVTWLDENKEHINIGSEDDPRYVEHLIINIQSEDYAFVQVTDKSYIEEKDIRYNTSGWENDMFTKAASYSNGKVSYYVSLSKLEQLLEDNNYVMPELYRNLYTGVRAPKNVDAYVFAGDEPKPIESGDSVEWGYYWHLLEDGGSWSIGSPINMGMWEFEWILKDDTRVSQKLSVEVTLVSDKTWMEAGGWAAIENDRMLINPDLNGSYGMIIKQDSDGKGHAYNHFTGNPVNEEKLRNINVFVGLEAPVITDESGAPIEITGYRANGSSGANVYIVTDHIIAEQQSFVDASPIQYFDMSIEGFEGKKIVPVNWLATFTSERLEAANGVLMDVYFYETYGTSIDNGQFVVINWIGENDEVVAKEFFYHTNDGETRSYKAKGKDKDDITAVVTEATVLDENCVLLVEIPEQSIVESNAALRTAATDKGAQYFQMTLEDTDGFVIQPDEDGVEILLPYPEGVNAENAEQYEFAIEHYTDESHTNKQKLQVTATENGLLFTATDFSPFMLSWTKIAGDEAPAVEIIQSENGAIVTVNDLSALDEQDSRLTVVIENYDNGLNAAKVRYNNVDLEGVEFDAQTGKVTFPVEETGAYVITVYYDENAAGGEEEDDVPAGPTVTPSRPGPQGPTYDGLRAEEKPSDEAVQTEQKSCQVLCRSLNVRAGAGTEFAKIGSLSRGQIVSGKVLDNGWIEIVMNNGETGYICGKYVDVEEELLTVGSTCKVVCRKLNVRAGAGTNHAKIGSLSRGETVHIADFNEKRDWVRIEWQGDEAWVCAKYIEPNR